MMFSFCNSMEYFQTILRLGGCCGACLATTDRVRVTLSRRNCCSWWGTGGQERWGGGVEGEACWCCRRSEGKWSRKVRQGRRAWWRSEVEEKRVWRRSNMTISYTGDVANARWFSFTFIFSHHISPTSTLYRSNIVYFQSIWMLQQNPSKVERLRVQADLQGIMIRMISRYWINLGSVIAIVVAK